MKPYRKSFAFEADFPFDYVYYDTKDEQNELPDHVHDWYELVYVYEGQGTFFIDQTIYEAKGGQLYFIPGNTIHRSFPQTANPKTSTALYFSPSFVQQSILNDHFTYLALFEHAKKEKQYQVLLHNEQRQAIALYFDQIHAEYTHKKIGFKHAIQTLVQQLLIWLSRQRLFATAEQAVAVPTAHIPAWLLESLTYIDEHYTKPLALSALARSANITPEHYARVFKSLTGLTLIGYVTNKRIIYAKELLQTSNDNVADIAYSCGFESIPYFHRKFKQLTGLTPAGYKNSLQR